MGDPLLCIDHVVARYGADLYLARLLVDGKEGSAVVATRLCVAADLSDVSEGIVHGKGQGIVELLHAVPGRCLHVGDDPVDTGIHMSLDATDLDLALLVLDCMPSLLDQEEDQSLHQVTHQELDAETVRHSRIG